MYFNDRYPHLIYSEKELKENLGDNIEISNNYITSIDIEISGHFGNCPTVQIYDKAMHRLLPSYNQSGNLGYVLPLLYDFFDKTRDDWGSFEDIERTPIRVVYDGAECVAIGHFMEDRYLIVKEFMSWDGSKPETKFIRAM